MSQAIDNQPLTIKDIREVLIPAMEGVFATKEDLKNLENDFSEEMSEKFDKVLTSNDKIAKNLETLVQENTMQYSQNRRFSDDLEDHEKRIEKLELNVKTI